MVLVCVCREVVSFLIFNNLGFSVGIVVMVGMVVVGSVIFVGGMIGEIGGVILMGVVVCVCVI